MKPEDKFIIALNNPQRGMSLLELIVAMGIGLIAIGGITRIYNFFNDAQKAGSAAVERESLKGLLRSMVNCDLNACTTSATGTLVNLYKKQTNASTPWITNSGTGTKISIWTFRAECGSAQGMVVKAVVLGKKGTLSSTTDSDEYFGIEPASAKRLTWASDEAWLYPKGYELCQPQNELGGGGGSGGSPQPTTPPPSIKSAAGSLNRTTSYWWGKSGPLQLYRFDIYFDGTAMCPSGYRILSGSANCQFGGVGGNTTLSYASPTGDGWYTKCQIICGNNCSSPNWSSCTAKYCKDSSGNLMTSYTNSTDGLSARCVKLQ